MRKFNCDDIADWLDCAYAESGDHITIERAQYNAAVQVLEVAGFKINVVKCNNSTHHIVE